MEEISYGERNFLQARGYASGPLIGDTVAYRLSGLTTRSDGYITNSRTGEKYNGIGSQALRGQLLIKPTDRFQTRLIVDFTRI